ALRNIETHAVLGVRAVLRAARARLLAEPIAHRPARSRGDSSRRHDRPFPVRRALGLRYIGTGHGRVAGGPRTRRAPWHEGHAGTERELHRGDAVILSSRRLDAAGTHDGHLFHALHRGGPARAPSHARARRFLHRRCWSSLRLPQRVIFRRRPILVAPRGSRGKDREYVRSHVARRRHVAITTETTRRAAAHAAARHKRRCPPRRPTPPGA